MRTSVIKHVVGVGNIGKAIDIGLKGKRRQLPTVVRFGGGTYLVGNHVGDFAIPQSGFDTSRLIDGPDAMALTYASMANLSNGGIVEKLVTCLPVEVYTKGGGYKQKVKGRMIGEHDFEINDKRYHFEIKDVVSIPQPAGTFLDTILSEDGKMQNQDIKAKVAICDIGFMSTDLIIIDKKLVPINITSTEGIQSAIKDIGNMIKGQYGASYQPHEIDEIIDGDGMIHVATGSHDISGIIELSLGGATNKVLNMMKEELGDGGLFNLTFTGGGVLKLRASLIREYPLGSVAKNPVLANAIGACKLARLDCPTGLVISVDMGQGAFKAAALG